MNHLKQYEFRKDKTRHRFALAGRRGGKTVAVREIILEEVAKFPPRTEAFYCAPSHMQAMELMWEPLEERLFQMKASYNALISKQRIELPGRRTIFLIGAEKISRVRGHALGLACLDEVAFYTKPLSSIWRAVRPALSDRAGRAVVTTTPNGKGTQAYDFYLEVLKKPEDWAYHYWATRDNPGIPREEIENAKRELDERSFKQEYEAAWESFEGLVYYCFDENQHIKPQPPINFELPLALTFDFNVNPTSLLLIQNQEVHRVKKEYSLKNSSTIETCKRFCEEFKEHRDKLMLYVHGDAAGSNRHSTTGFSDYHYIQEMLTHYGYRFQLKVMARNPAIVDRLSAVNSHLKSMTGLHRIEIDPQCSELIRDLSSQPLDGRFPSDKNNLGHKADALGYYIYWQHMIGNRRPQETIEL